MENCASDQGTITHCCGQLRWFESRGQLLTDVDNCAGLIPRDNYSLVWTVALVWFQGTITHWCGQLRWFESREQWLMWTTPLVFWVQRTIIHVENCAGLSAEDNYSLMSTIALVWVQRTVTHVDNCAGFLSPEDNYSCGQLRWFESRGQLLMWTTALVWVQRTMTHVDNSVGFWSPEDNYSCGKLRWFECRGQLLSDVDNSAGLSPKDNDSCGQLTWCESRGQWLMWTIAQAPLFSSSLYKRNKYDDDPWQGPQWCFRSTI